MKSGMNQSSSPHRNLSIIDVYNSFERNADAHVNVHVNVIMHWCYQNIVFQKTLVRATIFIGNRNRNTHPPNVTGVVVYDQLTSWKIPHMPIGWL